MSDEQLRLVFTHNNADFDAIAALLGMHLLDPTATAVLPPRLRHNVRNFMTLYASLLPTIMFDEVQNLESDNTVYLVDTQRYHIVPNLTDDRHVHIVDHHPIKHTFPEHYTLHIHEVGATATLMTEMLQEKNIMLSALEATLLMLGIYEDCGSLTYGTTTVRDIQASAWLLEQGADLDVLRRFLSYPLQDSQWEVVDKLRENMELLDISGHMVMIASAEMPRQVEGVSRVAHQLMNLFDPAALIMLVKMENNVQIVARSTIDEIDVGYLTSKLGGGGHARAAAALLRRSSLQQAREKLNQHLNYAISPSVVVADLMSTGRIETIQQNATVSQAARLMQISGHEGYPVLQDGAVIGLLTRRAVDRAMNHQMGDERVHDIMESSPDIYVTPEDSLDTLRQRMMDSGWGQMPVLNGNGRLLGIVTRTDLIRRWGDAPRQHHQTLAQQLQGMLPEGLWVLLNTISNHAQERQYDLYLVGGLVRDVLLGTRNLDLDFVVEGDAIGFAQALQQQYGGKVRIHEQFGTAKWLLDATVASALAVDYSSEWPAFLDFATARAEFYKEPTVLPAVRQSSIKQDLHRRDFTINSMAIRLAPVPIGTLIDYYNGVRDVKQRKIRVLHSLSFVDDPTRMIRAVRFEQRFGFQMESRTENLLLSALPFLDRVSGERLKNEFKHILAEHEPLRSFERLWKLGILQQISPAITIDNWFAEHFATLQAVQHTSPWNALEIEPDVTAVALMIVRQPVEAINAFATRLMLSKAAANSMADAHLAYTWLQSSSDSPPSTVVERLEGLAPGVWLLLYIMSEATMAKTVLRFVQEWRFVRTTIDGHQLQAMGVPPGPQMGDMLRQLRAAWLDGDILDTTSEHNYLLDMLHHQDE